MIPNGVDTRLFRPDIKSDIRKKLGLEEKKIILCTRRFVPKNGIEYVVRALPKILEEEDVVLLLAGHGRLEGRLRDIAKELGLEKRVVFLGTVPHESLPAYYCIADIIVQPSLAEARSLSCMEALACGSVLVSTNTGGLGEILMDGENAIVINAFQESGYKAKEPSEEDVKTLSMAALKGIQNKKLRSKVSKGARKTAEENSWASIADKMLDIYKRVI